MPELSDNVVVKKTLPIFYVLDTSGSMAGAKIGKLNDAMNECTRILKEKASELADAELKIGVLTFSTGAHWITKNGLVSIEDFHWNNISANGVTDLGAAVNALDDGLTRSKLLDSETGFFIPVLIFMSDGGPTDSWKKALKNATETNRWFKESKKLAIAIGDNADTDVLAELVGNPEAVVSVKDLETLKNFIVKVSVSASMLASKSKMVGSTSTGADIVKDAAKGEKNVHTLPPTNTTPKPAPAPAPAPTPKSKDSWEDDDWN